MYFPFLRGKQFELIALRDLCELISQKTDKISPIIEPVKDSSTLKTTLTALSNSNINFNIIVNPSVGDLKNKFEKILNIINESIPRYENFQFGVIIDENTDYQEIIDFVIDKKDAPRISLIHYAVRNDIADILYNTSNGTELVYNIIHSSRASTRYKREFEINTRVSLDDYFQTQQKNADYLRVGESRFSEEHLYFTEEGFIGFGDFLLIGESYSDSGFLPYAVAIHISYIDDQNKIRVKHFVSDSNGDSDDVAGKFAEALEKLIEWCEQNNIEGQAIEQFKDLSERQHFPGLGVLKKLSVINHIELVLNNI